MNDFHKDYRAIVINPVDPTGGNKCQIKILGLMEGIPDEDLPWAEYLLPLNYQFTPNQKGDHVWVDFPYDGDSRRPRIYGAAMDWQGDGKANVPAEAGGKGNAYQPPTGGDIPDPVKVTSQQDQVIARNKLLEVRSVGGGFSITNIDNNATLGFNEKGQAIFSGTSLYLHGKSVIVLADDKMQFKMAELDVIASGKVSFKGASMDFTAGDFAFNQG